MKKLRVLSTEQLVEKFQCSGCVCGGNTDCGQYKFDGRSCASHVTGTSILGEGNIALGMPKGFNRCGLQRSNMTGKWESSNKPNIEFLTVEPGARPLFEYDVFNVPVWKYQDEEGFVFVRVFIPRKGSHKVQVIQGAELSDIPAPTIDVTPHLDEMD